jgi:hypothetical protein
MIMDLTVSEARRIAKEATIYGFPLVDSYRINHAYFVDTSNPEFKAPWNHINNTLREYTPEDKALQTPNSDTPYSQAGLDLRAEPVVLTVPAVEGNRYFSVQLIDAFTHNFAYIGSRTTGNQGGRYLLAGPDWTGSAPKGIDGVIRSETAFVFALYRTQLINPTDLDNVKKVQDGYRLQTLSAFLGAPSPQVAPAIDFIPPLTPEEQRTSLGFFRILNFVWQYAPTPSSEASQMEQFARLGIGPGKPFDPGGLAPELKTAIADGMADAWATFAEFKKTRIDTGEVTSGDLFGTREFLQGNSLYRMAAAVLGIYGNSREEAIYPAYFTDASGQKLDGARTGYVLRFAPGQLPPVNAFWSLTLYELPSSLLSANVLNRYLINSPMLPELARDADGGLSFCIQHESPGEGKEPNWLPAPKGPFFMILRLYRPKPEALNGTWKPPMVSAEKEA